MQRPDPPEQSRVSAFLIAVVPLRSSAENMKGSDGHVTNYQPNILGICRLRNV